MSESASDRPLSDAEDVLRRYVNAKEERDLEALVACWADDIEAYHPLRPDRSWRGIDTYRRAWAAILSNPEVPFELVHADVVGNRIYSETLTHHNDGRVVPCFSILEVENGKIRRARVYTDVPRHDGKSMDDWVDEMND
jgi:hypothetical protein